MSEVSIGPHDQALAPNHPREHPDQAEEYREPTRERDKDRPTAIASSTGHQALLRAISLSPEL